MTRLRWLRAAGFAVAVADVVLLIAVIRHGAPWWVWAVAIPAIAAGAALLTVSVILDGPDDPIQDQHDNAPQDQS